jgi:NTP pyrophosphatase (non-canonical NTP hydrolase)
MTIQEAQQLVDQWIKTYGIQYFRETTNMVILMEEVGEMSRHISRLYGEQSYRDPIEEQNAKALLSAEMADVLFVLICLANQTNIDLQEALIRSIEKKTQRDSSRHLNNPKLKPNQKD